MAFSTATTASTKYKPKNNKKYINYYKVGVMDYFQGLNITLPFVREKNEIIIFESVKSVMKAYGWGSRAKTPSLSNRYVVSGGY